MTKEERYILTLYERSLESGDLFIEQDRYKVGFSLGFSQKVTNSVCNILLQANFIKKGEDQAVYFTQRGIDLAKTLK